MVLLLLSSSPLSLLFPIYPTMLFSSFFFLSLPPSFSSFSRPFIGVVCSLGMSHVFNCLSLCHLPLIPLIFFSGSSSLTFPSSSPILLSLSTPFPTFYPQSVLHLLLLFLMHLSSQKGTIYLLYPLSFLYHTFSPWHFLSSALPTLNTDLYTLKIRGSCVGHTIILESFNCHRTLPYVELSKKRSIKYHSSQFAFLVLYWSSD